MTVAFLNWATDSFHLCVISNLPISMAISSFDKSWVGRHKWGGSTVLSVIGMGCMRNEMSNTRDYRVRILSSEGK